ncbi:hypothetical protein INP57_04595 [Saccharopolyspora sp. HNM0986]|uniref:hypothetical protein n=1 Tax=Saccharopolyspora galaxeae TaxID=2781241 RepID=UPI00190C77CC|nr:hypothetical protein [Saccharopolyspora sp. HNM0986]MBK0866080.1 hypothetical protein [Saccharopolyspora sp. HNM0986]
MSTLSPNCGRVSRADPTRCVRLSGGRGNGVNFQLKTLRKAVRVKIARHVIG